MYCTKTEKNVIDQGNLVINLSTSISSKSLRYYDDDDDDELCLLLLIGIILNLSPCVFKLLVSFLNLEHVYLPVPTPSNVVFFFLWCSLSFHFLFLSILHLILTLDNIFSCKIHPSHHHIPFTPTTAPMLIITYIFLPFFFSCRFFIYFYFHLSWYSSLVFFLPFISLPLIFFYSPPSYFVFLPFYLMFSFSILVALSFSFLFTCFPSLHQNNVLKVIPFSSSKFILLTFITFSFIFLSSHLILYSLLFCLLSSSSFSFSCLQPVSISEWNIPLV